MEDARKTLNQLLVRVFNQILNVEERYLKRLGVNLSINDVHILECILEDPDNTMTSIASVLMVTQGTLTTNVSKLIERGYVTRYQDENDRRKIHLSLTEKATPILEIHTRFHKEMMDSFLDDLDYEDNVALIGAVERISNFFKEKV